MCYFSPLLTHALIKLKPKDYNSLSKHAMNAKDAGMQKLQEYSKQIKKML
jgi:ribonuclease HIII